MAELICRVYLRGARTGRSVMQHMPNGSKINFQGGCARISNRNDLPYLLRMPEAVVEFERKWIDWVPGWLEQVNTSARPVMAEVRLPEGFRLDANNALIQVPLEEPIDEPPDPWDEPPAGDENVFARDPGAEAGVEKANAKSSGALADPLFTVPTRPKKGTV